MAVDIPEGAGDVDDVIDGRRVSAVFQPVVDLAAGRLLGYEALARGPAGETGAQLFAAATTAGRTAELDWVARAAALAAAQRRRLHPPLRLFCNLEPATLRTPPPADLADALQRDAGGLALVVDLPAAELARAPARLVEAAARLRARGWGVALDDVAGDDAVLALLPALAPDVVKLDLVRLRRLEESRRAPVVEAVAAEVERTGAVLAAEAIADADDREWARCLGATVGQGWHYGQPVADPVPAPGGPWKAARETERAPLPAPTDPTDEAVATPFALVADAPGRWRGGPDRLRAVARRLALAATAPGAPSALLGLVPTSGDGDEVAGDWAGPAEHATLALLLGPGLPTAPAPGVVGVDLDVGEELAREWAVIALGPHRAAALLARAIDTPGPEAAAPRYDYVLTHDRDRVARAARLLLRRAATDPGRGADDADGPRPA